MHENDISYLIRKAAFEVHTELGRDCWSRFMKPRCCMSYGRRAC